MPVSQPPTRPILKPRRLLKRHIQGYPWTSGRIDHTLLTFLQRLSDAIHDENQAAILLYTQHINAFYHNPHRHYRVNFGYTIASVLCPAWRSYISWKQSGLPTLARSERIVSQRLKFPVELTQLAIALHKIIS